MAGCGSDEASIKSRQVSMKAAKIPRPPNAFILYRQHHHPRVKETYPDLTNNQICKYAVRFYYARLTNDVAVLLGKQWKAESEDVKLHFKNLAEEFKKKHAEDYPDYQYTPRKPSEKKRRATSRQSPKSSKRSIPAEFPPPMAVSSLNSCTVPMRSDTNDADVTVEDYMEPLNGLNIMFDPNGLATEHTSFDTNAFDALFQQVQGDYGRASLLPQLDIAEQSIGDPFGFSDFTADCF
ncbi:high mobility group box domain-containing protein [Aspergillus egyptiacus]|nr:high mobility group box domain-containing protein [Aspergillus egyptiacus]